MSDNFSGLYDFSNQFLSIILTTIVICTMSIIYNKKVRAHKVGERLPVFLILMESFILYLESLITSIMGKKYRKLTPYAMYIMLYIIVSSVISLLGIDSLTSSYTVTFSMGLVTFVGIYYFGLRYQKIRYFKKFLNPLELITQFVPLISISFRLFGNILGGSIILGLLYALFIGAEGAVFGYHSAGHGWVSNDIFAHVDEQTGEINSTWTAQYKYFWTGINPLAMIVTPFLHMYFDLFEGVIQAVVFTMLTMSYWQEAMGEEEHGEAKKAKVKKIKVSSTKNSKKIDVKENTSNVELNVT